jgi:ankyrin repeat protein
MKTTLLTLAVVGLITITADSRSQALAQTGVKKPPDEKLIKCVKSGDESCVSQLLMSGANAEAVDEQGSTALSLAAERESTKIVNLLLNAGADINKAGRGEGTPLCRAAIFGRVEIVKALLDGKANVDSICDGDHGDTALMGALSIAMLAEMPLDLKKDIVDTEEEGEESDEEEAKPSKMYSDVLDKSPEDFLAIARLLIAQEADANVVARCGVGETALMYAAMGANLVMVKSLLAHGADVNKGGSVLAMLFKTDRDLETGRRLRIPALSKEQMAMQSWLEQTTAARAEIKNLLTKAGAKIVDLNDDEEKQSDRELAAEAAREAFDDAIDKNDNEDFERLVQAYATHPLGVNALPEALRLAVLSSRVDMVKLLLERGVSPNSQSTRAGGQTLLMWAKGDLDLVKVLVAAGASLNATDENGRTVLDMCEMYAGSSENFREVARFLEAQGAKRGKDISPLTKAEARP